MRVISVMSAKGGVAKTTTALCLAEYLAKDHRVLFLDLDPQANATYTLLKVDIGEDLEGLTLYDVLSVFLLKKKNTLKEAIRKTEHLDLVPASVELEPFKDFAKTKSRNPLVLLGAILKPVADDYDFIVLDCPADLSVYVESAIHISDLILLPSSYDMYGFQGISMVLQAIFEIHSDDFSAFRVLYTQSNPRATKIKAQMGKYEQMLNELDAVLPFAIPLDQNVKNAQAKHESLMHNKSYRNSRARLKYEQLGEYILEVLS